MSYGAVALELVVTLAVVPTVVYFGVPLGTLGGAVTAREAVAVTFVGIAASKSVDLLLGGLTSVGWIFAPLVWIVVIKHFCPVEWPTAAATGTLGWGLATAAFAVLSAI